MGERVIRGNDNIGYCLNCGEEHDCIEPDARGYVCRGGCGQPRVYGAEEILMMGEYEG